MQIWKCVKQSSAFKVIQEMCQSTRRPFDQVMFVDWGSPCLNFNMAQSTPYMCPPYFNMDAKANRSLKHLQQVKSEEFDEIKIRVCVCVQGKGLESQRHPQWDL